MSEQKPKKEKPAGEKKEKPAGEKGTKAKAAAAPDKPARAAVKEERIPARLAETYTREVVPALMKRFNYTNPMQVPRLEKIAINIGVGQATQDA